MLGGVKREERKTSKKAPTVPLGQTDTGSHRERERLTARLGTQLRCPLLPGWRLDPLSQAPPLIDAGALGEVGCALVVHLVQRRNSLDGGRPHLV